MGTVDLSVPGRHLPVEPRNITVECNIVSYVWDYWCSFVKLPVIGYGR